MTSSESLVRLIRGLSRPLQPIPTGEASRLKKLPNIRAVIFDIYGTLFVSASGDISLAQDGEREDAMRAALAAEGLDVPAAVTGLADRFHGGIRRSHAASAARGIDFPEVEIRDIWARLFEEIGVEASGETIDRVAVRYECAVDPVWPMPGMESLLETLRQRSARLGIVSNAQFFTPLLFEALTEASWTDHGFRRETSIWSYAEGRAKPSLRLFADLAAVLKREGMEASEAIYVGNDMRNDIAASMACGFRSALFAGDRRSLRWRKDDPIGVVPDIVLTDLGQLPECLV